MPRKLFALFAVSAVALVVAACGSSSGSSSAGTAPASTGAVTIPQTSVSYAYYPCCSDGDVPYVGIAKGFFKDVGINITPTHGAQYSDASQVTPAMQRGTYDVSAGGISSYLDTLGTFGQSIPPVMVFDNYLGDMILVSPQEQKAGIKTAPQFMAEGMSYHKAAAKAMAEMKGQTLYTDPFSSTQPPYYNLFLSYAGLTTKDIHLTFLADAKTLALSATPGRVNFAFPLSGSVVVELLHNGWKPMISDEQVLDDDPTSSQGKQLQGIIFQSALVTQLKLYKSSPDTLMRFISAVYRSIAYVEDPKTAPDGDQIIANTIDSTQGGDLTASEVAGVFKVIDPLVPWGQQGSTFWNPKSPYYVPGILKTQIAALVANGTMKKGNYDLTKFLDAEPIYEEMKADQVAAQGLIAKGSGESLSGSKATLLNEAKKYYSWYDFLDAKRFAQAAVS